MATKFQPPPSYAEVFVTRGDGQIIFNPIWLKWFLDLAAVMSALGIVPGSVGVQHNALGGLQGGAVDEYFHLTTAQATEVAGLPGTIDHNSVGGLQGGLVAERYHVTFLEAGALNSGVTGTVFLAALTPTGTLGAIIYSSGVIIGVIDPT